MPSLNLYRMKLCLRNMKWKIALKLLYLFTLFALAAYEWSNESQLIDSDPEVNPNSLQQAHSPAQPTPHSVEIYLC